LYSFQVEGNRARFRTGQKNPASFGISEGKVVKFNSDEKGNVDFGSIEVLEDAAPRRAPSPSSSVPVASSRDSYWEAKEARDVAKDNRYQQVDIPRMTYSSAQDVAVKVVELAIAHGGLTLPTKKNAVLDAIVGAVEAVTLTLAKGRMQAPEAILAALSEEGSSAATNADAGGDPDEYG
jgi:hypothetical protein